jgi:hypothetical protein
MKYALAFIVQLFTALIWTFAAILTTVIVLPFLTFEIFIYAWNPKRLKRGFAF